ncbi:PepSY-associated TM helix domain-containing protein [Plebeiibacterium sediminum]|uniref:PepSY domain-containing protein n=1 Tax=Plebeiibacterium sediminum TaxID=2992112 RepID=A0AAE3M2X8_9BACT|nr:PepSY-associated TM helix domain-containing protein [Plebeiobacterium sediminum]MCW3785991.1 PepSY domain-containing protein [Plebeiobacterium sediminum]
MKYFLRQVHLWLSLPFGLMIILLCATGAILVFQTEWLKLFTPDHYYVEEVLDHTIPLNELIPAVEDQLPDSLTLGAVTISANPKENYTFDLAGLRHASVMVDPYSGKVRDISLPGQGGFFWSVFRLHRWLMMPLKRDEISWGKLIVGISTIMFLIILITGIIIWIPKSIKMLKNRLTVKWNKGSYRRWYDFHLASGIYASIFLIAFCITGLTWSFDWYRDGVFKLMGVEVTSNNPHAQAHQPQKAKTQTSEGTKSNPNSKRNNQKQHDDTQHTDVDLAVDKYAIWDKVVKSLAKEHPDFSLISVNDEMALLAIDGAENTRSADRYLYDPKTGDITNVQYNKDFQTRRSKVFSWIYKIHVGKWAGFFSKFLSFIACIIGIALTVTGYYMYFKKKMIRIK